MAQHRYRSQPTLQRSGGRPLTAILGLVLLAGLALGAGALVTTLVKGFEPGAQGVASNAPIDAPAPLAARETPPLGGPVSEHVGGPQLAAAPARSEPQGSARGPTSRPPARQAKPPIYPAAKVVTPQEQWAQWEKQRQAYDRARASYDANERNEGYRWAQQNRIRFRRHCEAAAGRTAAFVDGCLNYVRPRRTTAPDDQATAAARIPAPATPN